MVKLCSEPMGVSNDAATPNIELRKVVKSDGRERSSYRRNLLRFFDLEGGTRPTWVLW
jgi:hypothetical protein